MNEENKSKETLEELDMSVHKNASGFSVENQKNSNRIEIFRIISEFLSNLLIPAVIVFVVITFKPTIISLLSKTTEAEFAGTKWKFVQKIEKAVSIGDSKEVEKAFLEFRSQTSDDVLRKFWKPDGRTIDPINQTKIRNWMASEGIKEPSITFFLRAETYAKEREKAIRVLGLNE